MTKECGRPTHSSEDSQKLKNTLQIGGLSLSSNSLPSRRQGAAPMLATYSVAIRSTSSCFILLIRVIDKPFHASVRLCHLGSPFYPCRCVGAASELHLTLNVSSVLSRPLSEDREMISRYRGAGFPALVLLLA